MSKEILDKVQCAYCGTEGEFKVWESIDTMMNPETKELVKSGEIFKFHCPHCGEDTIVEYDTLYHQMEDKIMLHLVTEEESFQDAVKFYNDENPEAIMKKMAEGYRIRIVTSHNNLREKLVIFENNLDDRIIEMIKGMFIGKLMEDYPDYQLVEIVFCLGENGEYMLEFLSDSGECISTVFEKGMYEELCEEWVPKMPKLNEELFVTIETVLHYIEEA